MNLTNEESISIEVMDKLWDEYFLIWFFVIISWINILPDSSPVNINFPSFLIIPFVICSDDILLNFDISVEVKTSKITA